MTRPTTVIVIGAGIVGSSCAWHLQRRGYHVRLVDDQEPGQATSYGNAGCISPSSVVPFSYPGVTREIPGWLSDKQGPLKIHWRDFPALAPWFWRFWRSGTQTSVENIAKSLAGLMRHAHPAWDEILKATNNEHLREQRGCLVVYDKPEKFDSTRWQFSLMESLGFTVHELERTEWQSLEPAVHAACDTARLLEDWHHVINPGKISALIAENFLNDGGALVRDRVTKVGVNESGVTVNTASGKTMEASKLVCAAGVWSNVLAKQIDKAVPLTPKRGYHYMLPTPGVTLSRPVYFSARQFIATPMEEGLRLAGTAEFARVDAPPNYSRAHALMNQAKPYLPGLKDENASEWMGQRPMMPDSKPIISPSPRYPEQIIYAFGHGHYGLTQGPLTGRLVSQLVAGETPQTDLAPFRFDRF